MELAQIWIAKEKSQSARQHPNGNKIVTLAAKKEMVFHSSKKRLQENRFFFYNFYLALCCKTRFCSPSKKGIKISLAIVISPNEINNDLVIILPRSVLGLIFLRWEVKIYLILGAFLLLIINL